MPNQPDPASHAQHSPGKTLTHPTPSLTWKNLDPPYPQHSPGKPLTQPATPSLTWKMQYCWRCTHRVSLGEGAFFGLTNVKVRTYPPGEVMPSTYSNTVREPRQLWSLSMLAGTVQCAVSVETACQPRMDRSKWWPTWREEQRVGGVDDPETHQPAMGPWHGMWRPAWHLPGPMRMLIYMAHLPYNMTNR